MTSLRILTYNVRRCLGTDGRLEPARVADVIRGCAPDIVALQELDVGRARSDYIDQAHAIAAVLDMHFHFHAALNVFEERYGDAVLTRRPSHLIKAGPLPTPAAVEPRGALWICLKEGGQRIDVINTHFGLGSAERRRQAEALLGPDWIDRLARHPALILTGDFNSVPRSRAYRRLTSVLSDAQRLLGQPHRATFPSRLPLLRLDHFFVGPAIKVRALATIGTKLARAASDHLPLMMDFSLGAGPAPAPALAL